MVEISSCCICGCLATEFYELPQEDDDGRPCFTSLRMMNRAPGSKVTIDGNWTACFLCYRLMIEQWKNYELTNTPENLRQYWVKTFPNENDDACGAAAKNHLRSQRSEAVSDDKRSSNCAVCMQRTTANLSKSFDGELLRKLPEISLIIRIGFGVNDGKVTVCNYCSKKPPLSRYLTSEMFEKSVENSAQAAGQNICDLPKFPENGQSRPNNSDCAKKTTNAANTSSESSLVCYICAKKFPKLVAKRIEVVHKLNGSVASDAHEAEKTTPYSYLSNLPRPDGSYGPDEDGSVRVCPVCYIGVMQFTTQSIRSGNDLTSNEQQISLIHHINSLHRAYENVVQKQNQKSIPRENSEHAMEHISENSSDSTKHENEKHLKTDTESMMVDESENSNTEDLASAKQKFVDMLSSLDNKVYIENAWRLLVERFNGSAITFSEDQMAIAANKACEAFATNLASNCIKFK